MAETARRRGHAYQVLTDHSQSLAIARGLTPDRVEEQRAIIAALNARYAQEEADGTAPPETPLEGFRLLHGCELEIRADGELDYPDELLERFDLVVASVHVARRQSKAELTQRTLNGIRSPHVDVIAHPSGRMIGVRDDLDLDWDVVYAEAARTGTVLEMNGSPHRLDLAVERARRAVAMGCILSIDSDAHKTAEFDHLRWGITPGSACMGRARARPQHPVARRCARVGRGEAGTRLTVSAARTIPAMSDDRRGRRDLALAAVTIVGLSRLIEPPGVWLVAIFLLGAMLLGSLQVLGDESAHADGHALGVPIESLILPAVAAVACLGAIRLIPFGLLLVPALLVTGALVERCLALEARILSSPSGLDDDGRTAGPRDDARRRVPRRSSGSPRRSQAGSRNRVRAAAAGPPLPRRDLLVLAAGDAAVAFLLGYRAAALRVTTLRAALWSAATYAVAIAIAAAALRFDADPPVDGSRAADARVLPVGRIPCGRPVAPPRCALAVADAAAGDPRAPGDRPEPAVRE